MGAHLHFEEKCQYGYTHGQCRCASKDKITKQIMCTNPEHIPEDRGEQVNRATRIYGLESAGRLRDDANRSLEAAMSTLRVRVADAARAGMSKTSIAHYTGLSRQTVYTIIEELKED